MAKYWCVNFDNEHCLAHGIENSLWLMGYQYADDQSDSASRKGAITRNWRRLDKINDGDRVVAYLSGNRFYAVGTVRTPRRSKTNQDSTDTIEKYLERKESYKSGYVYFTPVVYENFTEKWRHPSSGGKWPVRIDVEGWDNLVPGGISVQGLNTIPPNELQLAVFEITKDYFDRIAKELAGVNGGRPKSQPSVESKGAVDDSAIDALETSHAKSQGFQLDSKLRKALEDYAMDAATQYFTSRGYVVEDHSKNHPYDLRCTGKKGPLYVEVKGTQTDGKGIFLTSGEVEFAHQHKGQMALFLLHSINVSKDKTVLTNGERHIVEPWIVDERYLKPVSFQYELPSRSNRV